MNGGIEPKSVGLVEVHRAHARTKAEHVAAHIGPVTIVALKADSELGILRRGHLLEIEADSKVFPSLESLAYQPLLVLRGPSTWLASGRSSSAGNDLSSLRWFCRRARGLPQRAAMLAHTPTIAVWDDHDFVGNNTLGSAPGKEVALRTFAEYWANPSAGTEQAPGVFFRYRYGDVDFFMLDDRYYRGLDGTLLGQAQTAWLEQELSASTATFKLLVSGSQFTSYGSSDSWAAYQSAQTALFDFIRDQKIDGVVLLSGDVHRSELRIIERNSKGGYDLPELTSSPMATWNSPCKSSPELLACHDDGQYFVTVDIDTTLADPSLTAHIIDAAGKTLASLPVLLSELSM